MQSWIRNQQQWKMDCLLWKTILLEWVSKVDTHAMHITVSWVILSVQFSYDDRFYCVFQSIEIKWSTIFSRLFCRVPCYFRLTRRDLWINHTTNYVIPISTHSLENFERNFNQLISIMTTWKILSKVCVCLHVVCTSFGYLFIKIEAARTSRSLKQLE